MLWEHALASMEWMDEVEKNIQPLCIPVSHVGEEMIRLTGFYFPPRILTHYLCIDIGNGSRKHIYACMWQS